MEWGFIRHTFFNKDSWKRRPHLVLGAVISPLFFLPMGGLFLEMAGEDAFGLPPLVVYKTFGCGPVTGARYGLETVMDALMGQ